MNDSFLRRILRLARPWWNGTGRWRIRGVTGLLVLLTLCQVGLNVWGSYWNRALFDALEARSIPGVVAQVGVFALILAVSIAVTAAHLLAKRQLQLDWRAALTRRLVGRWMADGRHHRLLSSPGEHDNPDQRIAEDIRIVTESAVGLAHTLVFSILSLGLFIGILWDVSGDLALPGTGISIPGYMVPLAFVYAGLGALLGRVLGRPLVRTTNALQGAEADFRFGLTRAREHSEAIALVHGEPREQVRATDRFGRIVRDWDRQSLAFLGIVSFTTAYGGLLPVFPILVAAPQYILGAMTLGALMQAAQAFQRLTSALSWPVDNVGEIARCRASVDRVLSLWEDMERLDEATAAGGGPRIVTGAAAGGGLVIEDLCITEPSGEPVLEKFSASIVRGEWVLLAGDSAVTSRLFKVIAGLWPWGSGRVLLPAGERILFVPQRPFLPEGTLREALCYPEPVTAFTDEVILQALECAGAHWLAPRLDAVDNWEQSLPQRAQQRLGLARVLMQRPAWVFLEEATDAFDPEGERKVLGRIRQRLPGTTVLTISFHPGLEALHDRKIVLSRAPA